MTQQGDSTNDVEAPIIGHALTIGYTGSWVVDSGATSHMCASRKLFADYNELQKPGEETLGDDIVGRRTVNLLMRLPGGKVQKCMLSDVPDLSFNLVSVSKASEKGKVIEFDDVDCRFINPNGKVVAMGMDVVVCVNLMSRLMLLD